MNTKPISEDAPEVPLSEEDLPLVVYDPKRNPKEVTVSAKRLDPSQLQTILTTCRSFCPYSIYQTSHHANMHCDTLAADHLVTFFHQGSDTSNTAFQKARQNLPCRNPRQAIDHRTTPH